MIGMNLQSKVVLGLVLFAAVSVAQDTPKANSPATASAAGSKAARSSPSLERVETLKTQRVKLQHALERLIDSFTEGLIEKGQFTARMARVQSRIAELDREIKTRGSIQ
jgi:hypothetical protein